MQTELSYDTVFDAQQHFRLLLDSMSRPGKINKFPAADISTPEWLNHAAALTGFALLNADTSYFVAADKNGNISNYLLVNTGLQPAEATVADYIFLPEFHNGDGLADIRTGTPTYPEDSATIIASVKQISEQQLEDSLSLLLKGPGVNGEAKVFVSGLSADLLDFVKEQNDGYPLGVDLIITDSHNQILCIPRSNKFTYTSHLKIDR